MAISTIKVTPLYPLELHNVKALFLARQYRQCIAACEKQLSSTGRSVSTTEIDDKEFTDMNRMIR